MGFLMSKGLRWFFSDLRHIGLAVLLIIVGTLAWKMAVIDADRDKQAARANIAEADYDLMMQYHAAFVADIQSKQAAAAAIDAANAAQKLAVQKSQNERILNDYENRVADSSDAADQLRQRLQKLATENKRDSGSAAMPRDFAAQCRAFGAPDCDAFFAALPEILAAAETNTFKLIGLQDWADGVIAVINADAAPPAPPQ